MTREKRHLLRSLLELVEQTTYLNKENQQLVTGSACWHGVITLVLKTLETWGPDDPHHATPFLLQLVQALRYEPEPVRRETRQRVMERVVRLEPAPRDPEEAAGDKKVAGDEEKVDEMGDDDM